MISLCGVTCQKGWETPFKDRTLDMNLIPVSTDICPVAVFYSVFLSSDVTLIGAVFRLTAFS